LTIFFHMHKVLIFFLFSNLIYSQTVLVQGVVKDSTNGKSIINIKISGEYSRTLPAQSNGCFSFYTDKNDMLTFYSHRHLEQKILVKDFLNNQNKKIILEPGGCTEYFPCEEDAEILVFIGKKINVDYEIQENYCDYINVDIQYKAKYQILKILKGEHKDTFIEFNSFEHPVRGDNFYNYEHAILYLKKKCNKYYHIKYQYDPLYKSEDNKFITTYDYPLFNRLKKSYLEFQLDLKKFKYNPRFKIPHNNLDKNSKFPNVLFKIKKNYAIAKYGITPESIFEIRLLDINTKDE